MFSVFSRLFSIVKKKQKFIIKIRSFREIFSFVDSYIHFFFFFKIDTQENEKERCVELKFVYKLMYRQRDFQCVFRCCSLALLGLARQMSHKYTDNTPKHSHVYTYTQYFIPRYK